MTNKPITDTSKLNFDLRTNVAEMTAEYFMATDPDRVALQHKIETLVKEQVTNARIEELEMVYDHLLDISQIVTHVQKMGALRHFWKTTLLTKINNLRNPAQPTEEES